MRVSKRVIRAVLRRRATTVRVPPHGRRRAAPDARDCSPPLPALPEAPASSASLSRASPSSGCNHRRPETNGTLIYLHGGAYALGSAKGYRGLAAQLAAAAGMTALIPDYSRAPEAQYPIALEEMVAVYSRLLEDGLDPKTTVIAGDSAGGGLTLALAMALRDRGIARAGRARLDLPLGRPRASTSKGRDRYCAIH